MATPQEIQKLLKELNQAYNTLGKTNPFANFDTSNMENAKDSALQMEAALQGVNKEIDDISSDIGGIAVGFKSIVQEIGKGNEGLTGTKKSFRNLSSLAQNLKNDQEGISKLNQKQLLSLNEKVKKERENLKTNRDLLVLKKDDVGLSKAEQSALNEANAILAGNDGLYKGLVTAGKSRLLQEQNINKSMGLGGAVVDGISKSFDKLGFGGLASKLGLEDAKEKMREVTEEITDGGKKVAGLSGKFKILKSGVGSMGKSLLTNLKDPLAISGFLINELISALKGADQQTGELAKSFGTSYSEASLLRSELNTIANFSGDININTAALQRSLVAINKEFGTSTMLSGELLDDFTQITEVAGITNETALKLSKITVATGGDLSDNASSILGQAVAFNAVNGLALNEKEILEGVSKLSNATVLSLGMQPKELAKAVLQAKALGVELSTVEAISSSLLQFESSIENELAAELLLGKDINLEKARTLALNGDIAGVAEEIAKQIGSAEDFTNMNVIQQEALAKAVGMTRDQLAGSLIERQALAAIGEGDKTALEAYNRLKKEGLSDAAIAVRLGDEELAANLKNQSVQDRFNKSVEKLREIFVSIADPIMQIISPIVDILAPVLSVISGVVGTIASKFGGILKLITPLVIAYGSFLAISKTILAIQKAAVIAQGVYNTIAGVGLSIEQRRGIVQSRNFLKGIGEYAIQAGKAVAGIPVIGPFLAVAAIAAAVAGGMALFSKMKDGEIDPSKGPVMTGEFGSVQLDPNDKAMYGADGKIKVGTDLFGGDGSINQSSSPQNDMSAVVSAINALNGNLNAIVSRPINVNTTVELDGEKIGSSKNVIRGLGNNSTELGTELSTNSSNLQ